MYLTHNKTKRISQKYNEKLFTIQISNKNSLRIRNHFQKYKKAYQATKQN
jgi:hypothetical protein